MTRRGIGALGCALGLAGALVGCGKPPTPPPPGLRGLLLITVDTLRADHVGAYGGPVPTPAMDRLAREGALVEQAVTPSPTTAPAHASLFTGVYPWRHGVFENVVPLGDRFATLAERLRERGFETAAFVSSYILHPRFGFARGFDHYAFSPTQGFYFEGRFQSDFYARGEATTRAVMTWLTQQLKPGAKPFFVWVHYFDPHDPYEPPPEFALSAEEPVDTTGKVVPRDVHDLEDLERKIRAYRGEVRYTDAQIGLLLERLFMLGVLDETAVILTADHGEGLGDHGVLKHSVNLFDELVRIPLLVRAPGVPAGRRLLGAAQLEDLYPTALALAGAPAPDGIDGVDLLPWLSGEVDASPRDAAVGRRRDLAGEPALYFERRWPRKWIGPLEWSGRTYSLDRDARESAGESGAAAPAWLRRDVEREAGTPARAPEVDAEVRRALEALGYAEPRAPGDSGTR